MDDLVKLRGDLMAAVSLIDAAIRSEDICKRLAEIESAQKITRYASTSLLLEAEAIKYQRAELNK